MSPSPRTTLLRTRPANLSNQYPNPIYGSAACPDPLRVLCRRRRDRGRQREEPGRCHTECQEILAETLLAAEPEYALVDGTFTECDRVGDGKSDYSGKHRWHGANDQVVTDPEDQILWFSPVLPGRSADLTATRTHRIIAICEELGIAVLADKGYVGAGGTFETPIRRRAGSELPDKHKAFNTVYARPASPGGTRGRQAQDVAHLPARRCSPNWLTSATAVVLTLTVYS